MVCPGDGFDGHLFSLGLFDTRMIFFFLVVGMRRQTKGIVSRSFLIGNPVLGWSWGF